jgi:hypothetical protein
LVRKRRGQGRRAGRHREAKEEGKGGEVRTDQRREGRRRGETKEEERRR